MDIEYSEAWKILCLSLFMIKWIVLSQSLRIFLNLCLYLIL